MGVLDFMKDEPSLVDRQRERYATPKHEIETRAEANGKKDKIDEAKLEKWRVAVRKRDKNRCQCCGRKVEVTLSHIPTRAECHHIIGRKFALLRYDVRNGVLLCLDPCHAKVTRNEIHIVQKAALMFKGKDGVSYINADKKLEFVE